MRSVGAMRELVEAVLEHRQSSYGSLAPTWVDGNELVVAVLRRLQADLHRAEAAVEIGELPTVFADRVQLGRVFQKLVGNAVRAAHPDRPVTIGVTVRRLGAA